MAPEVPPATPSVDQPAPTAQSAPSASQPSTLASQLVAIQQVEAQGAVIANESYNTSIGQTHEQKQNKTKSTCGLIGFIFALSGFAAMLLINFSYGLVAGVAALVLGIVGVNSSRRTMSIVAIVVGSLNILLAFVLPFIWKPLLGALFYM